MSSMDSVNRRCLPKPACHSFCFAMHLLVQQVWWVPCRMQRQPGGRYGTLVARASTRDCQAENRSCSCCSAWAASSGRPRPSAPAAADACIIITIAMSLYSVLQISHYTKSKSEIQMLTLSKLKHMSSVLTSACAISGDAHADRRRISSKAPFGQCLFRMALCCQRHSVSRHVQPL